MSAPAPSAENVSPVRYGPPSDAAFERAIRHAVYLTGGLILLAFGITELATAVSELAECLGTSTACFGTETYYLVAGPIVAGTLMIVISVILMVLAAAARRGRS